MTPVRSLTSTGVAGRPRPLPRGGGRTSSLTPHAGAGARRAIQPDPAAGECRSGGAVGVLGVVDQAPARRLHRRRAAARSGPARRRRSASRTTFRSWKVGSVALASPRASLSTHREPRVVIAERSAISRFIRLASAGEAPAVEIAIASGPLRTIAGRMKLHSGGTSTTLTEHRPRVGVLVDRDVDLAVVGRRDDQERPVEIGGRVLAALPRDRPSAASRASSSCACGATSVTAPSHVSSPSTFSRPTSPPPTTRQRRPVSAGTRCRTAPPACRATHDWSPSARRYWQIAFLCRHRPGRAPPQLRGAPRVRLARPPQRPDRPRTRCAPRRNSSRTPALTHVSQVRRAIITLAVAAAACAFGRACRDGRADRLGPGCRQRRSDAVGRQRRRHLPASRARGQRLGAPAQFPDANAQRA